MKIKVYSKEMEERGQKELPIQFSEIIRPDIIKRAVVAALANRRQRYGASAEAGKRASVKISKRRRAYRGCYGHGISRTPRKIMSRSGSHFNWEGSFAPQTVGGRRAHPPKAEKIWKIKINRRERRKAIRSAMAATINRDIVKKRGHIIPDKYPFAIDVSFEGINKTKDAINSLLKLGFEKELLRNGHRKIRAGVGTLRGRKYKRRRGILIVVSEPCALEKAVRNIQGLEVVPATNLNAEMLAPGTHIGRCTLYTDAALTFIEKSKLFTEK